MDNLDIIIRRANLEEVCSPLSGDCEKVALSMNEVFNVEKYVCIYEPGVNRYSTHATCRINGILYDGKGKTSRKSLKSYLNGMKPEDFGIVWNSEEEKINKIEEEIEDLIVEHDPKDNPFRQKSDEKIVNRLKKSKSSNSDIMND